VAGISAASPHATEILIHKFRNATHVSLLDYSHKKIVAEETMACRNERMELIEK
jgi:hypothetical protein